jgi:hypothetical protein
LRKTISKIGILNVQRCKKSASEMGCGKNTEKNASETGCRKKMQVKRDAVKYKKKMCIVFFYKL